MILAQERILVRRVLVASFGASLSVGVLGLFLGQGWVAPLAMAIVFALVMAIYSLACRAERSIRWMLALALFNALTVLPELSLRLGGFYHGPGIEFGYPKPQAFQKFNRDAELFWINPPNSPGFNSLGFRGRDFELPKPEGTTRVLFLGDSCTALGNPKNYPMIVEGLLRARDAEQRHEVVNLAVPGYSTYQGQTLARRYAPTIEADVVLVYFGWNDHWQAYGQTDKAKRVMPRAEGLAGTMEDLCLVQLVRWLRASTGPEAGPLVEVRVPPDDYRANLRSIIEDFRAAGTPVVLITAPSSFRRLGVPEGLVERGFLPDRPTGLERHEAYLAMTREAAELEGAQLLDLAARFDGVASSPPLLMADGVHLTIHGRRRMAEAVAERVVEVLAAR